MGDFFKGLFDFNFTSFVTPAVIRPLYILWVALAGLGSLLFLATSVMTGALFMIVVVPIFFVVQVIFARMYAELAFVVFDMNDRLSSLGGRRAGE